MHVASDKDPRMKRSGLHTLWLNRRICICTHTPYHRASLMAQQRMGNVQNLPTVQETQVWSRGREDPLEEAIATHSRILARRKPHGQRSLMGYSPGGYRESDMTEEAKHIPYHSPSITEEWKRLHLDRGGILRRWKDTSLTFSKPLRRWTLNREPAQMDC